VSPIAVVEIALSLACGAGKAVLQTIKQECLLTHIDPAAATLCAQVAPLQRDWLISHQRTYKRSRDQRAPSVESNHAFFIHSHFV
jgi:phage baseplate assembly protein gpV